MITLDDIRAARHRLLPVLRETPVLYSHTFSGAAPGEVYLKAESLQRTGSFKIRGAYNKIAMLPADGGAVVCVSAGNHAQGVALAAKLAGRRATVVMPHGAPLTKIERTRGYDAEVVLDGATLEQAGITARNIAAERGEIFVHPYDDEAIIAGQGTIGLEILEQVADITTVVVPVGGGGLIAGVALAIKEANPRVRVIGVQAEGAAAAERSFAAGRLVAVDAPTTLADGIRVGRVSDLTLGLMRRYVDDVVLVSDEDITAAVVSILDRTKLVVEGAGAAGVAAIAADRVPSSGKVCAILSGGNIDLNLLGRMVERALTRAGRYTLMRLRVADRPGSLFAVLGPLTELKINVLDIKHNRAGHEIPVGLVEIELLVETRDHDHAAAIRSTLAARGLTPMAVRVE